MFTPSHASSRPRVAQIEITLVYDVTKNIETESVQAIDVELSRCIEFTIAVHGERVLDGCELTEYAETMTFAWDGAEQMTLDDLHLDGCTDILSHRGALVDDLDDLLGR